MCSNMWKGWLCWNLRRSCQTCFISASLISTFPLSLVHSDDIFLNSKSFVVHVYSSKVDFSTPFFANRQEMHFFEARTAKILDVDYMSTNDVFIFEKWMYIPKKCDFSDIHKCFCKSIWHIVLKITKTKAKHVRKTFWCWFQVAFCFLMLDTIFIFF